MEETTGDQVSPQESKAQTESTGTEQYGMSDAEHEAHRRALAQRAKFKAENDDLKARLEKYEQERLMAEGKKDEALDYWKEKAAEYESKYKESTANFGKNQVKSQLTKRLMDAGCVEPDVAISLINREEMRAVDENFNVDDKDLERIVDGLKRDPRAQKVRLFSATGVNDITPATGVGYEEPKEDFSKLSAKELMAKLKE